MVFGLPIKSSTHFTSSSLASSAETLSLSPVSAFSRFSASFALASVAEHASWDFRCLPSAWERSVPRYGANGKSNNQHGSTQVSGKNNFVSLLLPDTLCASAEHVSTQAQGLLCVPRTASCQRHASTGTTLRSLLCSISEEIRKFVAEHSLQCSHPSRHTCCQLVLRSFGAIELSLDSPHFAVEPGHCLVKSANLLRHRLYP